MPRIYKGTTAKLALMYYPCVINPSDVSELTIAIYSEGTNEAIEYSLANMTLKDNIAFINLAKYQLDILDNGVIKYVARGVYKGNDFVQDRYSNYYVQTPKDYEVEDVAIQDIKKVDISELITNVLPDSGYDGMGEVIVDANPLINNVADNAVTLDVDKNGTYIAELADNYKGYIKEINVSVPSVNVEQLTQEEYDNITPDEDTLYVITDAPEIEIPDTSEFVTNSELADKNYVDIYYLDNQNYATNDSVNDTYNFLVEQLNEIFPQYAEKQWVEDKGYLKEIPEEYVTETELADKNYVNTSYLNGELEGYAKLSYVDDALANVGGGNGNIVELTQEEYNNITPDEETLYLISDVAPKENLKTINGESIIGTGDIKIDVDLTGYATEQWVDDKGYLKEIPEEYITETELNEALANIDSGNNIVSSTIFLEAIGDFGNKKILSDKVGYEEHNRAVYDRLYNIVNKENPSFSDETFFVNAEFNMNGLTTRMNGILSYSGDIIFSTFSTFTTTNINYSLWSDVERFIENYIYNDPMEFVIDVAHIDYHNIATTKYVDEQLGNINTILENILN